MFKVVSSFTVLTQWKCNTFSIHLIYIGKVHFAVKLLFELIGFINVLDIE